MGTVIQYKPRGNEERHQRWERLAGADLFAQYRDLQAQGVSQRQAATRLAVSRSTLQAWQAYQKRLDGPAGAFKQEPAVLNQSLCRNMSQIVI